MGPVRGPKRRRKAEREAAAAVDAIPVALPDKSRSDWWEEFSRRIKGPLSFSEEFDRFQSIFKISRKTFQYICSLVKEDLMARPTNCACTDGKVLSVEDQVAVALRRLSSGESLSSIGLTFGMTQSTVSHVTWRFVEAMEERGIHHLKWPSSKEMEIVKLKFEKIGGLLNCCGAIDTTHIIMCRPLLNPTNDLWVDHQKNHSMVLQAIVDADMRFIDIVAGWPGSMNDCQVLQSSGFFRLCEKGLRLNGDNTSLWGEGLELQEYIVGDEGFPLLSWLITPYQGKHLSSSEAEFNRRHFGTRIVAERAFARLKEMWKIIQGEVWRPDKHRLPRIILVCCLLHNIAIDLEDKVRDEMPLSNQHDRSYEQHVCYAADSKGLILRDKLSQCLSQEFFPS